MITKKEELTSEEGKKLWDEHFGFLRRKKEEPQKETVHVTKPNGVNSAKKNGQVEEKVTITDAKTITNDGPKVQEAKAEMENIQESDVKSKAQVLTEVSSQFAEPLFEDAAPNTQPVNQLREESTKNHIQSDSSSNISLYDVVKYFKNKGVVGEENLAVATTLALINKSPFGVEGYSGSGKTYITDKLIELISDKVYKVGLSSNQAIFRESERINEKEIIYIPELQKAMKKKDSPIIEVIKDLTEGQDSTRIVTKNGGNGTVEYKIKKGICIVYTLALENKFKKDPETSRRFIRFRTDSSPEHIDEIHDDKARRRYNISTSEQDKEDLELRLKTHLNNCMQLDDTKIIDPFSDYISSLIPRTQKSIGYVDHYYSLLDASAKFHADQRNQFRVEGQRYLLINLEDHYIVFQVYFNEFIKTLKEFSQQNEPLKQGSLRNEMQEKEIAELEYFEKMQQPDWYLCFREGVEVMQTEPGLQKLAGNTAWIKEWGDKQVHQGKLKTLDYLTGREVVIVDELATSSRGDVHEKIF